MIQARNTTTMSANKAAKRVLPVAASRKASRRNVRVAASSSEDQVQVHRRALLSSLSLALPLAVSAQPSLAAYGDAANVFGSKTGNFSGATDYEGDGYKVALPANWNPSKERPFPGIDLRYVDSFDDVNNLEVIVQKSSKGSITDSSPQEFLQSIGYILGETSAKVESKSEGGFAANKAAAASVLSTNTRKDGNGKSYYEYELLIRTADGNEGGRHQLISAAVSKGNLYVLRVQAGDKRWIGVGKGVREGCINAWNSFTVA
ncbi:photosystem II oxygen-evolving enhancer protein 2 [Chloropicon primus]|nr:photosystem II oxygen-evolving enhancer protein 2 [Chloropicon primus]